MGSIWTKETCIPERAPLDGALTVDAAVIGGGMAGILTARLLQEQGLKVAVLEADRIGGGQTRNTTAKITSQHGLIYGMLLKKFGPDKARQYADANQRAVERYRTLASGVPCGWEDTDAYLYSTQDDLPLRQELDAARSVGIDASFTTQTDLPFAVKGALRFPGQAQFQPLEFLKAMAADVPVYEHTRVTGVDGHQVSTDRGTVTARYIVVATHYPFINAPGFYFMRMHQERSYVIALEDANAYKDTHAYKNNMHAPDGMYYGIDPDGYSFRRYRDYLLLGGGNHRTGENPAGGRYQQLRDAAARMFPGSTVVAEWSAQDCITLDAVPYIGRYSDSESGLYVATGFHKWGMTGSMVSAMVLSSLITGSDCPYAEVFSPQRFQFSASAKTMMEEGAHALKGLSRHFLHVPETELDALPNGHGGVVDVDGEKAGVYKNDAGEVFIVSAKCPHLGCELEWNPDELSWDCPCHGSRFDFRGNLLDNPAMSGLDRG